MSEGAPDGFNTGFNTEREQENKSPLPVSSVKVRFTEDANININSK